MNVSSADGRIGVFHPRDAGTWHRRCISSKSQGVLGPCRRGESQHLVGIVAILSKLSVCLSVCLYVCMYVCMYSSHPWTCLSWQYCIFMFVWSLEGLFSRLLALFCSSLIHVTTCICQHIRSWLGKVTTLTMGWACFLDVFLSSFKVSRVSLGCAVSFIVTFSMFFLQ